MAIAACLGDGDRFDRAVAITVGVAGSFALVCRDVSNILAGVAIAISLVPVLAVVGITLGSGSLDLAWGAFVLFLVNAAAIIVAGWSCSRRPATSGWPGSAGDTRGGARRCSSPSW